MIRSLVVAFVSILAATAAHAQVDARMLRQPDVSGTQIAFEGQGVDPDIVVMDDPTQLARGTDPQLERAIPEVRLIETDPPVRPRRPPWENRTPTAASNGGSR